MKVNLNWWRSIDGETVFTAILLVIAVYMFVGSYEFSSRATTFPRMVSGAAIIGCVLLLISGILPDRVQAFIAEEARIVQHDDEPEAAKEGSTEPTREDEADLKPINSMYTALLIAGYIISAYLVGFFITTPLFIVAYILVFDINRLYGGILLLATIGIVYGFEQALNVPMNEGFLFMVGI